MNKITRDTLEPAGRFYIPEDKTTVTMLRMGSLTVVETETISEVDEAAEAYLKAPKLSRERAEALQHYRELISSTPQLFIKTPVEKEGAHA